jgi:hypothetical protein
VVVLDYTSAAAELVVGTAAVAGIVAAAGTAVVEEQPVAGTEVVVAGTAVVDHSAGTGLVAVEAEIGHSQASPE